MAREIVGAAATVDLGAPTRGSSSGLVRTPLPELDWTDVLQQRHRYRCWAWRSPGLEIAGVARAIAVEAVGDWRLGPMADDVALCVSELIGNALTHGSGGPTHHHEEQASLSLGLRYFPSTCLFVEVGDASTAPPLWTWLDPELDPAETLLINGRGLMILRRVADLVWWRSHPREGKTVYARLNTTRYFEALAGGGLV